MHMDPTPATISSISKSTPLASWGVPYDQLAEEKKKWPCLQMLLHDMHASPKVDDSLYLGHS